MKICYKMYIYKNLLSSQHFHGEKLADKEVFLHRHFRTAKIRFLEKISLLLLSFAVVFLYGQNYSKKGLRI